MELLLAVRMELMEKVSAHGMAWHGVVPVVRIKLIEKVGAA
jgi:hypothetical protein